MSSVYLSVLQQEHKDVKQTFIFASFVREQDTFPRTLNQLSDFYNLKDKHTR